MGEDRTGHPLLDSVVRDRYHVQELLGRGGMGSVFAVHDRETGQRHALKLLESETEGFRLARQRFRREFAIISRFSHPNVVKVTDYGELEDRPFYVMELLTRSSLAEQLIRQGDPCTPEIIGQRLRSLLGPFDALAYIHEMHVVHRDLKPSNLILGEDGHLKITDFGLAVDFDSAITLTQTGVILGSLSYMSPEQAQGRRVDHRTDLYAMGVILYELFTGQRPFTDTNPLALVRKQVMQRPVPPSSHNRAIPPRLDDIILKLLQKDPADRYPDARALAEDVERFLRGERPTLARPGAQHVESGTRLAVHSTFTGRLREMAELQKALEAASVGEGCVAFIRGETGVGKTRFVEEFCARARLYGVTHLKGRAGRSEGVYYRPFVEILESYDRLLGTYDEETERTIFEGIGRVLGRLVPRLLERRSIADSPEPSPLDPAENKLRLFDAVVRLLGRLATVEPLVLLMDDMQWADELTLEMLGYLGRNIGSSRILLVVVARDDEPAAPGRRGAGPEEVRSVLEREGARTVSVRLGRLDPEETARLARSLLPRHDLDDRFLTRLHHRTAGNPCFVEEVVRQLRETGALARGVLPEELPDSVDSLMQERLKGVPEEALSVLTAASVIGQEFDFELLQTTTCLDEGRLLDDLEVLLRAKLIDERGEDSYGFAHPLLQPSLYKRIQPRKRRLMYRTIAEALEARPGEAGGERIEALASHWRGAGEETKATLYTLEAGRLATAANAHQAARDHFEAALRLLEGKEDMQSAERQRQALEGLYDSLLAAGTRSEAEEAGRRLLALAERTGDAEAASRARYRLGKVDYEMGRFASALDHWMEGLKGVSGPSLMVPLLSDIAFVLGYNLGRPEQALPHLEDALGLAEESGDPGLRLLTLRAGLAVHSTAGRTATAVSFALAAVDLARETGRRREEWTALSNVADVMTDPRRIEERATCLRQAIEVARGIGDLGGQCHCMVTLARLLDDLGDPESDALVTEGLALAKRIGRKQSIVTATMVLAWAAYRRGDLKRCELMLADILSDPEQAAEFVVQAGLLRAWAVFRQGRVADALRQAAELSERIAPFGATTWPIELALARATMSIEAGRPDEASRALEEFASRIVRGESPRHLAEYRFLFGRIAALRRDAHEADDQFRRSMPFLASLPQVFLRANFRLDYAEALDRLGRTREAAIALREAEADFKKGGLEAFYEIRRKRPLASATVVIPVAAGGTTDREVPASLLSSPLPFVGRQEDILHLQDRLREVLERGKGCFLVYQGPTGIGKTRLLQEFASAIDAIGVRCLRGAARSDKRSTSLHSLLAILQGALDGLPLDALSARIRATLRLSLPELADHPALALAPTAQADAAAPASLSPEMDRVRVQDAVARLLEIHCLRAVDGRRPGLVVLLDDLAAADETTIHVVSYLARNTAQLPLLMVVTFNPDEVGERHPWTTTLSELVRNREAAVRDLGPLTERDLHEILEKTLGQEGDRGVEELAGVVAEKSGGNPLFARELLLTMFRNGWVVETQAEYEVKTSSIHLPDTVIGLVRDRLSGLTEEERRVLQYASALGREFDFDVLMDTCKAAELDLLDRLERLGRLGIVEPVANDPLGRDLYRFRTPQMRDAVYSETEGGERIAIHQRAGEALERASFRRKGISPGELAHHFVLGAGGAKARDCSLEAGRRAARACANQEAIHHLENAIRLMQQTPGLTDRGKLFDAWNELATVRIRIGDSTGADRCCSEAIAVAETPVQRAKVFLGLSAATQRTGNLKHALRLSELGIRSLCGETTPDRLGAAAEEATAPPLDVPEPDAVSPEAAGLMAQLLTRMAFSQSHHGELEEALALVLKARAHAERSQDAGVQAYAARTEGVVLQDMGRSGEACKALQRGALLYRGIGDRWGEATVLNVLAIEADAEGKPCEANSLFLEATRLFAEAGDLVEHAKLVSNIGWNRLRLGEWDAAETTLRSAMELSRRLAEHRLIMATTHFHAELLYRRGRLGEARSQARLALEQADGLGLVTSSLSASRLCAQVELRDGNIMGAREHLQRALSLARAKGLKSSLWDLALQASGVETAAKELGRARELVAEAHSASVGLEDPSIPAAFDQAEARIALEEGRIEDAVAGYRRALAFHQPREPPYKSVEAALDLGTALVALEQKRGRAGIPPAREVLTQAREAFARLGAPWHLSRVDELLQGAL